MEARIIKKFEIIKNTLFGNILIWRHEARTQETFSASFLIKIYKKEIQLTNFLNFFKII